MTNEEWKVSNERSHYNALIKSSSANNKRLVEALREIRELKQQLSLLRVSKSF
jgi:hypothetical protein